MSWFYFAGFVFCAGIILFGGQKLSVYGEALSVRTGIGKAFFGLFLMSLVTSLPELFVGISSSALVKSADLATGDILGSCAFNLCLLSVMDLLVRNRKPLFTDVSQQQLFAATFGIILFAFSGVGIFLEEEYVILPFIGLNSILFVVIYFLGLHVIYKYRKKDLETQPEEKSRVVKGGSMQSLVARYVMFSAVTIAAALALPFFAEKIGEATGIGQSFMGTFFLAISTSLPEVAVSVAALKSGSSDLAVGNLLGSNLFNIFILFVCDLFYQKGHLLKDSNDGHLITVFALVIMSSIVIIGIAYKSRKKRFRLGWDTALILLVYVFSTVFLYRLTA